MLDALPGNDPGLPSCYCLHGAFVWALGLLSCVHGYRVVPM